MTTIRYRLRTFQVATACVADGPTVAGPYEAVQTLRAIFADLDRDVEHFVVLALNVRGKVNGFKVVAQGTATASLVHPACVFRAAMLLSAVTIIVAHNHPSGDLSPSEEDTSITQRLKDGGKLLGIPVIDHIIVTEKGYRSVA